MTGISIAVIDYQTGNLASVCKALCSVGGDVQITSNPADLRRAERIVLPGVGHFSSTARLFSSGMADVIREKVENGTPFLGICVGLQWLFFGSTEAPEASGLSIFPGHCDRFPRTVKSPHVGWNSIEITPGSRLLSGLAPSCFVYFTHSYRAPRVKETTAVTFHGEEFSAAIEDRNWMAVQFHPEKSGDAGLRILSNFLQVVPC